MLITPLAGLGAYGALALRVAIGAVFTYTGWGKLKNPSNAAGMLGDKIWLAYLLGLSELLAGIFFILGLYTEVAALIFVVIMLGALYFKLFKWKSPFMGENAWALDLVILGGALALLLAGAGSFSIDFMIGIYP